MRLKAVVIILRKDGYFRLADAIIHRSWGFRGFPYEKVKAYYRKDKPVDGYGVACIFELSSADIDFFPEGWVTEDLYRKGRYLIWFPKEEETKAIQEALNRSDYLTEKLLGRGWGGRRPFYMLHHFM